MTRIRAAARPIPALLAILAVLATASAVSGATSARHTRLVKSEPAANDTLVKAPAAIKLWFSERVELPVTRVRLADAAGRAIGLEKVARPDTGASAPVVVAIAKPLAAGSYVIKWSTAAKDGHAENGTIAFVVKGAR